MIIHHMSDGTVRKSIEGVIVPITFSNVYKLAQNNKRGNQNGNSNTSGDICKK